MPPPLREVTHISPSAARAWGKLVDGLKPGLLHLAGHWSFELGLTLLMGWLLQPVGRCEEVGCSAIVPHGPKSFILVQQM